MNKDNLDEMKRLRLLCEDAASEAKAHGQTVAGEKTETEPKEENDDKKDSKKTSKREIVDEEPATDSQSSFRKDNGKPFKIATNPRAKDDNADKVKKLADNFFRGKPYSSARIGPTKDIRRYSYPIYGHDLGKGTSLEKPEVKETLRKIRDSFLKLCDQNGVKEGSVDVKFHVGSGVYASVQIKLPTDAKPPVKEPAGPKTPPTKEQQILSLYKKTYNGKLTSKEFATALAKIYNNENS